MILQNIDGQWVDIENDGEVYRGIVPKSLEVGEAYLFFDETRKETIKSTCIYKTTDSLGYLRQYWRQEVYENGA